MLFGPFSVRFESILGVFVYFLLLFQVYFILDVSLQIRVQREGSLPFWLAIAVRFV